jgi:hypothetical protein
MNCPMGKRNVRWIIVVVVIVAVVALLAIAVMPNQGGSTKLYTAPSSQMIVNSNDLGSGWYGGYVHSTDGVYTLFNKTTSDNATVMFQNQINTQFIKLQYYIFKFKTADEASAAYGEYYSFFSGIEKLSDPGIGDRSWNYTLTDNPSSILDRFVFVKGNVMADVWVDVSAGDTYTTGLTAAVPLGDGQVKGYAMMQEAKIQ